MLESVQVKQCTLCWQWKSIGQMEYTKHGKYTHYICRDCINYLTNQRKGEQTNESKH